MNDRDAPGEERPICTVDAVLLVIDDDMLKVLLHKRPNAPFQGAWALPGGYIHVDDDDDTDGAIQRIMADKTGLEDIYLEQLRSYSGTARDPRGWSVSIAHLALVPRDDLDMNGVGDNVALCDVGSLPPLAFDHEAIVSDALARLRGKGGYSSLPASLLPETFTLLELRRAYEIALSERIDASAFRRKIMSLQMIEETGETSKEASSRPAAVYRLTKPARTFNRYLGGA